MTERRWDKRPTKQPVRVFTFRSKSVSRLLISQSGADIVLVAPAETKHLSVFSPFVGLSVGPITALASAIDSRGRFLKNHTPRNSV